MTDFVTSIYGTPCQGPFRHCSILSIALTASDFKLIGRNVLIDKQLYGLFKGKPTRYTGNKLMKPSKIYMREERKLQLKGA